MGGAESVFQVGCLPDMPDVRTDDQCREEHEKPTCLAFFRPTALLVKSHLSFHLLEVFLLLITQPVRIKGLHRTHLNPEGHVSEESRGTPGIIHLFPVDRESDKGSVRGVVFDMEPVVVFLDCHIIIQGFPCILDSLKGSPLRFYRDVQAGKLFPSTHGIEVKVELEAVSLDDGSALA